MYTKFDSTLDTLYNKKIRSFHHKKEFIIPKIKLKIDELKKQINNKNEDEIKKHIDTLEQKLNMITKEVDFYFLENSK